MARLNARVVLDIGSTSGIARALAGEGADIVMNSFEPPVRR